MGPEWGFHLPGRHETVQLVDALDIDPATFAQQMREQGCEPTRDRVPSDDGRLRQVRGYRTADIRAAVRASQHDESGVTP